MKLAKFAFLLLGAGLLWLLLRQTDLAPIVAQSRLVGVGGMLAILGLDGLTFAIDVASWQQTLPAAGRGLGWTTRLYGIRMIGEAYNNITPMASMGGEPVKAWLLKRRHGIGYRDAGASLVLAKTTSMVGLVLLVGVGCVLVMLREDLSSTHQALAGASLALLTVFMIGFFLMQHWKLSTFAATRLGRTCLGARLSGALRALQDIDLIFAGCYAAQRRELVLSTLFGMVNWLLGVAEI